MNGPYALFFESKEDADLCLAKTARSKSSKVLKVRYGMNDKKDRTVIASNEGEVTEVSDGTGGTLTFRDGPVFYFGDK